MTALFDANFVSRPRHDNLPAAAARHDHLWLIAQKAAQSGLSLARVIAEVRPVLGPLLAVYRGWHSWSSLAIPRRRRAASAQVAEGHLQDIRGVPAIRHRGPKTLNLNGRTATVRSPSRQNSLIDRTVHIDGHVARPGTDISRRWANTESSTGYTRKKATRGGTAIHADAAAATLAAHRDMGSKGRRPYSSWPSGAAGTISIARHIVRPIASPVAAGGSADRLVARSIGQHSWIRVPRHPVRLVAGDRAALVGVAPIAPCRGAASAPMCDGASDEPGDEYNESSAAESPALMGVYLDASILGEWMTRHLEQQVTRPRAGVTAVDPRLSPSWN